jgi:hypothetical protein
MRLRGCEGKYMVKARMKADLSRFWFTFRTWRTGAGGAA